MRRERPPEPEVPPPEVETMSTTSRRRVLPPSIFTSAIALWASVSVPKVTYARPLFATPGEGFTGGSRDRSESSPKGRRALRSCEEVVEKLRFDIRTLVFLVWGGGGGDFLERFFFFFFLFKFVLGSPPAGVDDDDDVVDVEV